MLTEQEAIQKLCLVHQSIRPKPMQCCGSQCVAYWKWSDVEHTIGYCAITGKSEF